jgi:NAD-dependent DNA ligase
VRGDGKTIERRFGEKNAAKVVAEIERSRTNDLWRLIYGLGIRHIGERGAQVLAKAFGSVDALVTPPWNSFRPRPRSVLCLPSRCGAGSTSRATASSSNG